jgi:succinyl-CoA synthetase beta subunit
MLARAGLAVPTSQLLISSNDQVGLHYPVVIKAQVLSGKRKDAGGILFADNDEEAQKLVKQLFSKEVNQEKVEKILVEEKADTYILNTNSMDKLKTLLNLKIFINKKMLN